MTQLRCPKVDLIGRALIEAYRHLEESVISNSGEKAADASTEIARLQELITAHRLICTICKSSAGNGYSRSSSQIVHKKG